MKKYKITRDDLYYEDDKYMVLVKDQDVLGNMIAPLELVDIFLGGVGEALSGFKYNADKVEVIEGLQQKLYEILQDIDAESNSNTTSTTE